MVPIIFLQSSDFLKIDFVETGTLFFFFLTKEIFGTKENFVAYFCKLIAVCIIEFGVPSNSAPAVYMLNDQYEDESINLLCFKR